MSDHFSYLYKDNEAAFFQKEACDAADKVIPRANEIVKTASQASRDAYTLEKVASRIDQDIFIIKTAGESGFNFGAQRRALGYMNNLLERVDMDPETAEEIFDKVAAEAISHDLDVVRAELYKMAGEEHHPWIDSQIASAGIDLVKAAELEKEALNPFKLMKGTFGAAKTGLKATKGLGGMARVKAVTSAPGRAWRTARVEGAAASKLKAGEKLLKAKGKLSAAEAAAAAAASKLKKLPLGLQSSVGPGIAKRTGRAVEKATSKVEQRSAKLDSASSKLKDRRAIERGKTPPSQAAAGQTSPKNLLRRSNSMRSVSEMPRRQLTPRKVLRELATLPGSQVPRRPRLLLVPTR